MLDTLFVLFFLASISALFFGLIKPALVKMDSRKKVLKVFGSISFLSLFLIGIIAPEIPQDKENQNIIPAVQNENKPAELLSNQLSLPQNNAIEGSAIQPKSPEPQIDLYKVIRVVDGDTITVDLFGKNETLRLIGINSPETVDPRKPVECFGKEASDKAKDILTNKSVRLEADATQGELDKYNRLLRYVFLEDGTNFNELMISEGYAYEYTYNVPYKFQDEFKKAEKEAKETKKGLWADGICAENIIEKPIIENTDPVQEPKPIITPTPALNCSCSSNIYNCDNFATHQEAQALYNCCIQKVGYDVHRLDRDKDGLACEALP